MTSFCRFRFGINVLVDQLRMIIALSCKAARTPCLLLALGANG